MGLYNNQYEIDIKLNGTTWDIEPSNYSFIISDNINDIFPTMQLTINDLPGIFQETMAFIDGIPIEITYGLETNVMSSKYVVESDQLEKLKNPNFINGIVRINFIHDYFFKQETSSKGYKKSISSLVRDLTNKYSFSKQNIDATGNQNTWYQMLATDSDFIEDVLLPNAYSTNAEKAPFYAWIDCNNEFNFKNYSSMINSNSVATLEFVQESSTKINLNTILDIQRYRTGSFVFEDYKNRQLFTDNEKDGSVNQDTDSFTDYPRSAKKNIPSIKSTENKSIIELGHEGKTTGQKDNVKGRRNNSMKPAMSVDNFIVTTYLNPKIRAGTTLDLKFSSALFDGNSEESVYFSDKYIVEQSKHIWNGGNNTGFTQAYVSRKHIKLTNEYLLKPKLFSS